MGRSRGRELVVAACPIDRRCKYRGRVITGAAERFRSILREVETPAVWQARRWLE